MATSLLIALGLLVAGAAGLYLCVMLWCAYMIKKYADFGHYGR